ncbi:MORN repeat-containing protein 5-like [Tachypleus tridentatus]|uniref:MORN repeat-containing protein 5-like n=1 Tax=Tachypleus tridentatus TaxID=6853 RepID=UPI003FD65B55
MDGKGTYILPTGTRYEGSFENGMFHGNGKIIGILPACGLTGCYTSANDLQYSEENWTYCQYPDRRFWTETCNGLKQGGKKT